MYKDCNLLYGLRLYWGTKKPLFNVSNGVCKPHESRLYEGLEHILTEEKNES